MTSHSIIIVDIETTGLYSDIHDIVEIVAIEVDLNSNKVLDHFHTFSIPTNEDGTETSEIDPLVTEITGITIDKLQGAPENETAIKRFRDFAKDRTIWAYNAAFVLPFLDKYTTEYFIIYDVMSFAKKTFPDVIGSKLSFFTTFLNIPLKNEHPYSDCLNTKELLVRAIEENETIRTDNAHCYSCQWSGKVSDLLMLNDNYICPECTKSEKLALNFPLKRIPEEIIFNDGDDFFCGICDWKGSRSSLITNNKKYACPRCIKSKIFPVLSCNSCDWFNLECFSLYIDGKKYCPHCLSIFKCNPLLRLDN